MRPEHDAKRLPRHARRFDLICWGSQTKGMKTMNGSQDINLNSTECLVRMANFGATTVTNICTGAVHTVPWGTVDWAMAAGLFAFAVAIVTMFGAMTVSIIRD